MHVKYRIRFENTQWCTKNILTVLLTSGIAGVVMEIFKEKVIYDYANSCASFYGVDRRYFSGIEVL